MTTGRQVQDAMEIAAREALAKAAHRVLEDSNEHIGVGDPSKDPAPGFTLSEHGHVEVLPDGQRAVVWYEGPYAAWQEQNEHAKHPRGGGPHFLSNALKKMVPQLEGIMAGEIRAHIDGRVGKRGRRGR